MSEGPKIVKQFDVADEIINSNARRQSKGLRRIVLDELHDNQPHELADHLIHDCSNRLLPHLRANPRNTHPTKIGDHK